MPCDSGGGYGDDRGYESARLATRAACEILSALRNKRKESSLSRQTLKWIAIHDEKDKQREQQEKESGERERLKQKAMAKLNQDERKALGLR